MKRASLAAAAALALWLAWDISARVHRVDPGIVRDTATAAAYAALQEEHAELVRRADRQAGVIGNLQAELAGLRRRPPRVMTVYDTLVRVDTVTVFVRLEAGDGELRAIAAGPVDTTGLRQPRRESYDVRDCDRWWLDGSGLICQRSPWGHLWAGIGAGAQRAEAPGLWAGAWLRWRPSTDSPWSITVEGEPDRVRAYVGREVRLF